MKPGPVAFGLATCLVLLGLLVWWCRGPGPAHTLKPLPDAGPAEEARLPGEAADKVLPLVLEVLAACGRQVQPACSGGGQLSFRIAVQDGRGRVSQLKVEPTALIPEVDACVRQGIGRLEFGRGLGSGKLEVIYPVACRDGQLRWPTPAGDTRTRPRPLPPRPTPEAGQPDPQDR